MYDVSSKSSKIYTKIRITVYHFCLGDTLSPYIKVKNLIQIFILILPTKIRGV